jgi:NADH-quinone oxidoreductase subunit A
LKSVYDLTGILIFFFIGAGFVLLMYMMVAIVAPTRRAKQKVDPYECGELITGQPWVHVHIRYYIFAMLFLIFDIETVFLFPWAIVFKKLGLFGLIEMVIFILILIIGLVYPWKKGSLTWEYSIKG